MTTDFYVSAPGETRPPVPTGPMLCSGNDMRVVHNAFLWAYEQAPDLVRGVLADDTQRSAFVGAWLADLDSTLHVHHQVQRGTDLPPDRRRRQAKAGHHRHGFQPFQHIQC